MAMIVITHRNANPIHGYYSHYPLEGEPNPWLCKSLPTGRRTQSMAMIVITHRKVNPIHGYDSNYTQEGEPNPIDGYDSHYPLEGEPNPWL